MASLENLRSGMSEEERKLNELATQKSASIWLTTLPIKQEGYILTKQQFWDLLRIRYGWELKRLPLKCKCGANFHLDHALGCKKGGFMTLRHNHLRNFTCALLKEVCKDVRCEPLLQPITGEALSTQSIKGNEARLDVAIRGS